jgi:hypothetical protein
MCSIKMGFLIGSVIVIFLITSITSENNVSQSVIISNTRFPLEDGTFYLYEVYEDKVVLQEYPAFYYNQNRSIPLGTPIKNSQKDLIGHVIGHHRGYYPITTSERGQKLYCGHYELEQLSYRKQLFYRNQKFNSIACFRESVEILQEGPFETLCFVYKSN